MTNMTIDENVSVKGLNNTYETVEIKPLNLTTKSGLAVTQPIVTNSMSKGDTTTEREFTFLFQGKAL